MRRLLVTLVMAIVFLPALTHAYEREYLTVLYPGATPQSYTINLREVLKKGDTSYAPVNEYMRADKAALVTMDVLDQFKKENPNLVIIDWKPMYGMHNKYVTFLGIYIEHKKRR